MGDLRALVVGVGGVGGTIAGTAVGVDPGVTLLGLTTNREIAAAIGRDGFRVGNRTAPGEVLLELPPETEPFDLILLATRPPQVEDAARTVLPFLRDDGAMVVLCNGLCEQRVTAIAGEDRVFGAIVAWGAAMSAPGVFDRTSYGGFVVGRLDGQSSDPRFAALTRLLAPVGAVTVTDNLVGARWSKLAINCAISSLGTIGGDRLGVLMRARVVRRLALELITEVVAVAQAEGVRLQKISGTLDLPWLALSDGDGAAALIAKHAILLAVGTKYRNLRSSMLRAIERGREPGVEFLCGEIVDRGRRHGIPTPANAAAGELVQAIARGEQRSSMASIRALGATLGL
jgi:2-dehydropantoate 2-reductase